MTDAPANDLTAFFKPEPKRIDKPGLYDLSDDDYFADPCIEPSLNASTMILLALKTARHAWAQHPRFGGAGQERKHAEHLDIGTGGHALFLQGLDKFQIIDATDYKTNAAKAAREAAWKADRLPILKAKLPPIREMVAAAHAQVKLDDELALAFADGQAEQTLIWQEQGVWCRLKLDWLPSMGPIFPDVKFTGDSAHVEAVTRRAFGDDLAYWLRARFYERGILAVLERHAEYRLVTIETKAPFAMTHSGFSGDAMERADQEIDRAILFFKWCCEKNRWPGYRRGCHVLYPPRYMAMRWEKEDLQREADHAAKLDQNKAWFDWLAPPTGDQPEPANTDERAA